MFFALRTKPWQYLSSYAVDREWVLKYSYFLWIAGSFSNLRWSNELFLNAWQIVSNAPIFIISPSKLIWLLARSPEPSHPHIQNPHIHHSFTHPTSFHPSTHSHPPTHTHTHSPIHTLPPTHTYTHALTQLTTSHLSHTRPSHPVISLPPIPFDLSLAPSLTRLLARFLFISKRELTIFQEYVIEEYVLENYVIRLPQFPFLPLAARRGRSMVMESLAMGRSYIFVLGCNTLFLGRR